ncbi:MAG: DMT family transporter [Anaerolineae bacterium]|nr:DMT family transporter [Anaerolineae bacterium]
MKRWQADLALGIIALIWGGTFVIVQNALDAVGPLTFVAFRFALASLVLIALFARRLRSISRIEILAGGLIGVWLAGGYTFQTIGLQSTTTAKTGFITGLSVVIVPVLSTVLLRRPPGRGAVIGIIAATVGLGFLSLDRNLRIQSGDLWVLACALMFALHIVTVAHFSPHFDSIRLAIAQIVAVMVLATGSAAIFETPTIKLPLATWAAIAFMGVVATALVFSVQVYVQRFTTPTHTALLFSLEPVFAAFFGWWLANEQLGLKELTGCGLILAGMIVAELGGAAKGDIPVLEPDAVGTEPVHV